VFARIIRLRRAVKLLRQGCALADVAVACGYYDQAHMTRDFRDLAGHSPGEWKSRDGELTALFAD
jgi:transcriptional regulator GlxA family with amidase domain